MPRKNLIRSHLYPYHVTIRCNNKEWFDLPLSEIWQICLEAFAYAISKVYVKIQAFVLMSNHYHLLIWTPDSNLDRFMFFFNYNISKKIRVRTGRINRIFGDRYRWTLVQEESYFNAVLIYIYQNPLRQHLVLKCEDYPFSTLKYFVNNMPLPFLLDRPFSGNLESFLIRCNSSDESSEFVSQGLKKPVFRRKTKRLRRRKALI